MPSSQQPPRRPSLLERVSSAYHYSTFPMTPPKHAGPPQGRREGRSHGTPQSPSSVADSHSDSQDEQDQQETPLPKGQLIVLAVIALAEQTALNSISPYLPDMASTFPEVADDQIGLYVGLIASTFALAQFATNFLWGWLSDRVGRKPIVLLGTILTAVSFVAFGFCRTLWQAILVQALMGLVNGNQGVISTCLGEITDRSNQSRAFTYLPVIYGIGGITGPLVGGLLVLRENPFRPGKPNPYPYLLPNLVSAAVLLVDFVVTSIFLQESLESAKDLPPIQERVHSLFAWFWQFTSSHRPTYLQALKKRNHDRSNGAGIHENGSIDDESDEEDTEDDEQSHLLPALMANNEESALSRDVFSRDTILLLISYLIFQLSNVGYNSLYPIFAESGPPTGRGLIPSEVGSSLAIAGAITIVFQVGVFGRLREKVGNKSTYRASIAGFVLAFLLMPWIGYKDGKDGSGPTTNAGKIWLWVELGAVLLIKSITAVGGLTSALLLITNSSPSHAVLGTLNGLAQTLSAAGRAVGPFISGALFTAATNVHPKGEALAFGIFGGISFIGFLMSFGIRGAGLEADGWEDEDHDEEEGYSDDD